MAWRVGTCTTFTATSALDRDGVWLEVRGILEVAPGPGVLIRDNEWLVTPSGREGAVVNTCRGVCASPFVGEQRHELVDRELWPASDPDAGDWPDHPLDELGSHCAPTLLPVAARLHPSPKFSRAPDPLARS